MHRRHFLWRKKQKGSCRSLAVFTCLRLYAFSRVMICCIRLKISNMFKNNWRIKVSSIIRNNSFRYVNQPENICECVRKLALEIAAIRKFAYHLSKFAYLAKRKKRTSVIVCEL